MRTQTLMPSPILYKSTLCPPDAMKRRGSNVSSVHYADELSKLPSSVQDTDKVKGKGKGKSAGTRLLN
ncbi:hypothetical protein STEG23_000698, partial [Scotinomys teguina]